MIRDQINKLTLFIFPSEKNNYRPIILDGRFFYYVTLVLVLLKFVSLFYFTLIPKTPYFADVSRGVLIQMTNNDRELAGLKSLNENRKLNEAAELKAHDMLQRDYFSHWSPDGISPWHWFSLAGYDYSYAGENLAIGFLNTKDVHRSWMASPDHKGNILGPDYSDIGMAVVEGDFYGQRTFLIVQVFGSRLVRPVVSKPVDDPIVTKPVVLENEPESIEVLNIVEESSDDQKIVADEELNPEISSVLGIGSTISAKKTTELTGIKYSIFNFLVMEYDAMVRQLIFYVMIFLGFIIVANVFVRFNVQHPDLIFKGLAFFFLFLILAHFDQMTLVRMIMDPSYKII